MAALTIRTRTWRIAVIRNTTTTCLFPKWSLSATINWFRTIIINQQIQRYDEINHVGMLFPEPHSLHLRTSNQGGSKEIRRRLSAMERRPALLCERGWRHLILKPHCRIRRQFDPNLGHPKRQGDTRFSASERFNRNDGSSGSGRTPWVRL